jgi:hypothetical protein
MRPLLALPLLLAAVPVHAETAQNLGERLDMTSFPNSIGPRREDGARTLKDYGFTKVQIEGETVRFLEPDESWVFAVRPLATTAPQMALCIEDQALNGGSYHIVEALEVTEGTDGLLHATGNDISHPDCAERE